MAQYYKLEDIKKELEKRIREDKAKLQAWEKVEIVTKKDGKPFANMSKNFVNAKYYNSSSLSAYSYELEVFTRDETGKCLCDTMNCYELVKYLDEEKQTKTQNYMPKESFLEQHYKYDMEDIKQSLEDKKTYYAEHIQSLKNQLENIEEIYNNTMALHKQMMDYLRNATTEKQNTSRIMEQNSSYHLLVDLIKTMTW